MCGYVSRAETNRVLALPVNVHVFSSLTHSWHIKFNMPSCVFTLPTTKWRFANYGLRNTVENYTVCDETGSVVVLVHAGA
jgi:hypothetical protein